MNLIELAERVEAAEASCRELDVAIMQALNPEFKPIPGGSGFYDPSLINALSAQKYITKGTHVTPFYTSSLDAAMKLVPEGYFWTVGKCDLTCHATVGPDRAYFGQEYLVKHEPIDVDIENPSTPALALTAACLRAMAGATAA